MPVLDIHFEDGIFFCREEGRIDEDDARLWAEYANLFASQSIYPIVALIDATDATFVSADARRIFARAAATPNLAAAVVATKNFLVAQNTILINMLSTHRHTEVFETLEEAHRFAQARSRQFRRGEAGTNG